MGRFTIKALGLPRYLWIVLAVAAVIGLWVWAGAAERADDRQNQELGAAVERGETATETLERVEQGNEIREQVEVDIRRGGSAAMHAQCLRSNRGDPAVCERFLPQRPAD